MVGRARSILLPALLTLGVVVGPSIVSAQQLNLSWVDNSGGQASFIIQKASGITGPYTQFAQVPLGVMSYTDTTVSLGTTYCYQVAAVNSAGVSDFSNVACGSPTAGFDVTVATTGSGTVVSAPAGITCPGTCVQSYAAGRVVTLTATPVSGSFFSGWSGGGCAGTAPCVMAGNTPVTVTATFSLDNTAPTVSIGSPASGASVSGSVSVAVNAADNVAVTRVELWVDGALLAIDTTASGSFAWDSTTKPNGTHSLLAKAYDAAGNVASSTSISVTVNNSQIVPSPTMTLAYSGKLRDRVGQDNTALAPDGALDGTLTATLSAAGGRTVTGLRLDSNAPGIWDTDSATQYWVLAVATTLDGPVLNAPGTMAVNFAVTDGGSFVLFASDYLGTEFLVGNTLRLTATFADGSTATATTTVANAAPATLTLVYNGKLRDRVGQDNTALAPDGALDGTLTATLSAAGGRTVTGLRLDSNAPGIWDTDSATPYWVLAVATTLDGQVLNAPGTMAVNFAVTDGGSFVLFASDYLGTEFLSGNTLTLTATFADGSMATAVTTVP